MYSLQVKIWPNRPRTYYFGLDSTMQIGDVKTNVFSPKKDLMRPNNGGHNSYLSGQKIHDTFLVQKDHFFSINKKKVVKSSVVRTGSDWLDWEPAKKTGQVIKLIGSSKNWC